MSALAICDICYRRNDRKLGGLTEDSRATGSVEVVYLDLEGKAIAGARRSHHLCKHCNSAISKSIENLLFPTGRL